MSEQSEAARMNGTCPSVCYTMTISMGPPPCKHLNGTYRSIPARWFGRRTVLVCGDCESVLDAKTKRVV